MTNQSIPNGTLTNDTNCSYFIEPEVSAYVRFVVTASILAFALVGNMMVLQAICKLHGRMPLIYQLARNLAVGELGQVILAPLLLYYEETWSNHGWRFGEFLCKVVNPLHNVFLTNVTFTMAAIAILRCLTVYFPPRRRLTRFQTKCLLTSFWCVGVAIVLPQVITRQLIPCHRNPAKTCCGVNWESSTYNIYNLIWNSVVQYIPIIIMITAYTLVAVKIRRHIVIIKEMSQVEGRASDSTDCTEDPAQLQIKLQENPGNKVTIQKQPKLRDGVVEMENNLLKMMYMIIVSFLLCYPPYPILLVLFHYGVLDCWRYSWIVAMYSFFVLSNLPSALHPLFYGTKSKFFAKAFSLDLSCRWEENTE